MTERVMNLSHFTQDTDLELDKLVRMGLITQQEKAGVLDGV
jgi:hypothetical protein